MPKFHVTGTITLELATEIDAEDEDAAWDMAGKMTHLGDWEILSDMLEVDGVTEIEEIL